jgi:gliding motility-associated-like protein
MYIPNAFTPNGDGKNDVFECFSSCQISYFNLAIFDRNGERVFQSDNISKYWNGEYKNESLSNSIYIYNLIVSYSDGKTERYKGSIILIK